MEIFVARQPIFDRRRQVIGYELLFRNSLVNVFGKHDSDHASLQMMDTTLLGFGLDSLVGDKLAFFNASREVFVQEHWAVLPPGKSVIELLETVEPDAEVIEACRALKNAGYQLALDDFVFRPEYETLLQYADFVKIDFLITTGDERAEIARNFLRRGIRMLAEKVETYAEFQHGLAAGYELFQGYFFCKPEMVTGKDLSPLKASLLLLIQEVNRPEVDFDRLELLIKREVALSVKLLRFLHSAGFGWRHEVHTISQALRVLGEGPTRKWASLVALTLIGEDKPPELVTTSLVRAQFCEAIGKAGALADRQADCFLAGLLSTLDALLDRPMAAILEQMAISQEIHDALICVGSEPGGETPVGQALALAISYDRADWERVEFLARAIGFPESGLPGAYAGAVAWVGSLLDNG
ncbi:MAG: HDOD domain-containing protein [Gemmatimonadales bacterium]